jgi:hypothetical protein
MQFYKRAGNKMHLNDKYEFVRFRVMGKCRECNENKASVPLYIFSISASVTATKTITLSRNS